MAHGNRGNPHPLNKEKVPLLGKNRMSDKTESSLRKAEVEGMEVNSEFLKRYQELVVASVTESIAYLLLGPSGSTLPLTKSLELQHQY